MITVSVEEDQCQMIMLALAELAKARPGWNYTLGEIAKQFHGFDMYENLRTIEERCKLQAVERNLDGCTCTNSLRSINNCRVHGSND